MGSKPAREVMYLKYEFSNDEKLAMATTLAQNHNAIDDLAAEEKVFKTQIAERRSGLAQSVQTLSRNISMGFEMRNMPCLLQWDKPNVGEVQYVREDNGEVIRTRPMTESERQMELPMEAPKDEKAVEASVAASEKAVDSFFGGPGETGENLAKEFDHDEEEEEDESDLNEEDEDAEDEDDEVAVAAAPEPVKRGRGRPRKVPAGFTKPTNPSSF